MPDPTTVDPNAVIEAMSLEVAHLARRAVVAETAVAQLQQQLAALAQAAEAAREGEPERES